MNAFFRQPNVYKGPTATGRNGLNGEECEERIFAFFFMVQFVAQIVGIGLRLSNVKPTLKNVCRTIWGCGDCYKEQALLKIPSLIFGRG